MANCVKCGAPLRAGAKFCGACGAKIEAPRFCTQCGQSLEPGEAFCTQCGAPADGPAPAPRRRGRPPKDAAPADGPASVPKRRGRPPKNAAAAVPAAPKANREKKPDYPDVRGFYRAHYGQRKAVSAGDEALVWCEGGKLYRLERDWTLHSWEDSCVLDVIQTKEAILVLQERDYEENLLVLKTYDKQLSLLSEKVLCQVPAGDAVESYHAFMTQFDLFVLQYTEAYDAELDRDISTDISLRQIDLATGETREWRWDRLEWEGWTVSVSAIDAVDGERPYLPVELYQGEDGEYAILIFDPQTGGFSALWQGGYFKEGRPMFYDWEKRVMWTHPTKAEMERRQDLTKKSLVARKIAPSAPMLSNMSTWKEYHEGGYFTYFDGRRAYYAPAYFQFFCYGESGIQSEDWNRSGHGRAETAVVWPQADKIVMDLMADYYYTIYPLSESRPSYDELISLRQ